MKIIVYRSTLCFIFCERRYGSDTDTREIKKTVIYSKNCYFVGISVTNNPVNIVICKDYIQNNYVQMYEYVNKIYYCCTVYIDFSQYMHSHETRNIYSYITLFSLLYCVEWYTSRNSARSLGVNKRFWKRLCLETEFVFCDTSLQIFFTTSPPFNSVQLFRSMCIILKLHGCTCYLALIKYRIT